MINCGECIFDIHSEKLNKFSLELIFTLPTILKQAAYITLIFILLMQSGGVQFLFKMMQYKLQNEMAEKMQLHNNDFTKIQLTLSEYQKSKISETEILYKGKLYDIKSTVIKGKSVQLIALNDTNEEHFLGQMKEISESNRGNEKTKLTYQLINLLTLTFISTSSSLTFMSTAKGCIAYETYKDQILVRPVTIFSPPPEWI